MLHNVIVYIYICVCIRDTGSSCTEIIPIIYIYGAVNTEQLCVGQGSGFLLWLYAPIYSVEDAVDHSHMYNMCCLYAGDS